MKFTFIFHRVIVDAALIFVIVAVAVFAEMGKNGVGVGVVLVEIWHWTVHAVTDVTSAEVIVTVIFKVFGAVED